MHLATSNSLNSPETTKILVIGVASFMTVALGGYFVVSYRRNQRAHGPLTPAESTLNRGHGVAILLMLVISMGLAIGSVLSPTIRDALSVVGDNSRWIPVALIPLVLVYVRWLTRKMAVARFERMQMNRPS